MQERRQWRQYLKDNQLLSWMQFCAQNYKIPYHTPLQNFRKFPGNETSVTSRLKCLMVTKPMSAAADWLYVDLHGAKWTHIYILTAEALCNTRTDRSPHS
jgi:hypothetical protein